MLPDFGSHDVIGHVTIRPAVGCFLFVPHWHQPCILCGFGDIKPQIFWGSWRHRSRDHKTCSAWFPTGGPL